MAIKFRLELFLELERLGLDREIWLITTDCTTTLTYKKEKYLMYMDADIIAEIRAMKTKEQFLIFMKDNSIPGEFDGIW